MLKFNVIRGLALAVDVVLRSLRFNVLLANEFRWRMVALLSTLIGALGCGGNSSAETDGSGGQRGGGNGAGSGGNGAGSGGLASGGGDGTGGLPCAMSPADHGAGARPDNVVFVSGVMVATLAGGATSGATDGAPGVGTLDNPVSVAIEPGGTLAVSDFDNDRLRRVATDGTLSTLARQSDFTRPFGLAMVSGVLYAHTDNNPSGMRSPTTGTIWRIDSATGMAAAVGVNLGRPRGFAALSDGRLALGDYQNQRVRLFDPATGTATDLAGTPGCAGSANGTSAAAQFKMPYGVVVLAGDRIIVADRDAHVLREVTLAGVVTTFAGDGVAGTIDGPRASARFVGPKTLAADASGAVYVSDDVAHRIRRIAADGTVTTVAGDGIGGFMDGAGNVARFYGQEGIAVSADGRTVYVADGTAGDDTPGPYHRIRKITVGP